jgi:transposase InsO family protein
VALTELCELFSVSRSWYYDRPITEEKVEREVALRNAIHRIVLGFPDYGYRRVTKVLQRQDWTINHKRVLRTMRKESLLCQLKRRFKPTTDSVHSFGTYPNLIKHATLGGPDKGRVADITYVRFPATFCYLASILDAFSRYCVAWSLSRWIDTRLTLGALEMALGSRLPQPRLIHHADRGAKYASSEYVTKPEQVDARISMAAVGNPSEDAKAESFFRSLKMEEIYLKDYQNFEEAEENIGE